MRKKYAHVTEQQKEEILRLYKIPTPTPVIARNLDLGICTVQKVIREAGLTLSWYRDSACYQNTGLIRELAAKGASLSEIARQVSTNRRIVRAFLTKHKIHLPRFHQGGKNNPAWKGGRMLDKSGYVLVWMPDHPEANRHGYVREHRILMEKKMGRSLLRSEVCHHKDDNRSNNDPDNLELFSSNGEHLAETLKGKCPNWSEDGVQRIRAANYRPLGSGKKSTPAPRKKDGQA